MKHWVLLLAFSVWEHWLGRTERVVANSTWALIKCAVKRFLGGKGKMEQDIKLGTVGDIDFKLVGGKAVMTLSAALPVAAAQAGMTVSIDGGVLADKLKAAIEAKYPASSPIDEAVFALLKTALSAL